METVQIPSKAEMEHALEIRHTKAVQERLCRTRVAVCGLMAPRVMLCAAHQANQILEIILKGAENDEP